MLGPTASGKSEIAMALAERVGGEILSVDSMQVYRGMDIGTAKPSRDHQERVPHHLIDVVAPEEEFSVHQFREMARQSIARSDAPVLIIAGGSGLHFRSIVDPMTFAPTDHSVRETVEAEPLSSLVAELLASDADAGAHMDLSNHRRVVRAVEVMRISGLTPSFRAETDEAKMLRAYVPEVEFRAIGVDPGEALSERIAKRLEGMLTDGLLEEVRGLEDRMGRTAAGAVGYRELIPVLGGESIDAAVQEIQRNSLQLARRQRSWFRRDPRIEWIPWKASGKDRVAQAIEVLL